MLLLENLKVITRLKHKLNFIMHLYVFKSTELNKM